MRLPEPQRFRARVTATVVNPDGSVSRRDYETDVLVEFKVRSPEYERDLRVIYSIPPVA